MLGNRDSYFILGIAVGFFFAIGLFVSLDAAVVSAGYCDKGETYSACAREWIGSLSGWVAAAAALFAIVPLCRQLKEQKRQTDFALGDAPPTISASTPVNSIRDFDLRIVNWNRLAVDVLAVRVSASNAEVLGAVTKVAVDGKSTLVGPSQNFEELHRVNGWENRADAPSFATLSGYVIRRKASERPLGGNLNLVFM